MLYSELLVSTTSVVNAFVEFHFKLPSNSPPMPDMSSEKEKTSFYFIAVFLVGCVVVVVFVVVVGFFVCLFYVFFLDNLCLG